MAPTNNDLRMLIIKKDLEEALKKRGIEKEILESDERETLEKFYQDEESIHFIREIIMNKELLLDTNKLLQQVELNLSKKYSDNQSLIEIIHRLNLQLLQRIGLEQTSIDSLYGEEEPTLASTQKI